MIVFTGLLFMIIGLLCILKPEFFGMFDGLRIKPSSNKFYLKYIRFVGIGMTVGGFVSLFFTP